MAGGLKAMARHLGMRQKRIGLAGALLLACAVVRAESAPLPDPTRPPAGFLEESPKGGAPGGAAEGAVAARQAAEPAAERPAAGLQSVLIPRQGKPVAIIGGRYVPLGERWEGWELVEVHEAGVVLARGRERKVLRLTPAAEKKNPGTAPRAAGPAGRSGPVRMNERLPAARGASAAPAEPRKESETGR